jgi:Alanine racemase, N-terminal domain
VPLTLYVDFTRWYAHLRSVIAEAPGLVPVAKGNGYGFGVERLARTAARLQAGCIAVGSVSEAATVLGLFPGEVVVTGDAGGSAGSSGSSGSGPDRIPRAEQRRVIYTASSLTAAAELADRRVIVECRSSLLRQGVEEAELAELRYALGGRPVEGFALHLPIDRPRDGDPVQETVRWMHALAKAGFGVPTMYVSHLSGPEIAQLSGLFPDTRFRLRAGTRLWLGDRLALRAAATVQQAIPVSRGDRLGYRQNRCAHDGWLVVVSGGTAHGVGLEAPKTVRGLAPRIKSLVRSGLASMNLVRSPFCWQGRKQWFAEPPHMLHSMLLLPRHVEPPWSGAELTAELRHTATVFDEVLAM